MPSLGRSRGVSWKCGPPSRRGGRRARWRKRSCRRGTAVRTGRGMGEGGYWCRRAARHLADGGYGKDWPVFSLLGGRTVAEGVKLTCCCVSPPSLRACSRRHGASTVTWPPVAMSGRGLPTFSGEAGARACSRAPRPLLLSLTLMPKPPPHPAVRQTQLAIHKAPHATCHVPHVPAHPPACWACAGSPSCPSA